MPDDTRQQPLTPEMHLAAVRAVETTPQVPAPVTDPKPSADTWQNIFSYLGDAGKYATVGEAAAYLDGALAAISTPLLKDKNAAMQILASNDPDFTATARAFRLYKKELGIDIATERAAAARAR